MENNYLHLFQRIKAIADTGLVYADSAYDQERYEELKEISLQLMSKLTDTPLATLENFFLPQNDYPTPKVDVRAFILNEDDQVLMTRESVDGKWTIPGGWADINTSPKEAVIKEVREETGLNAEIVRLLAVYDKQKHKHPPEPYHIYKLMFYCKVVSGELSPGFDMLEVAYFPLDELPELSKPRILQSQLEHLHQLVKRNTTEVYVD